MTDHRSQSGMSRRGFLGVAGMGLLGCSRPYLGKRTVHDQPSRRPNIIVIVSDDQGYADSGCYGCTDIPTPHIDSLARDGILFTDGYVSCPVCSPTRAGLVTGRYQHRFGWELNPGPGHVNRPDLGVSVDEITIADILQSAGYSTGIVGKWHLGAGPEFHPLRRGFDEFYGFLGGWHNYLPDKSNEPVYRNETVVQDFDYLTDAFTREAVAFIKRHSQEPFFLYLAYNAVHRPMEATPRYLDRFPHIDDPERKAYAAMLSTMDDGIGEVRKALRDEGLEEDTLVFFMSDNGGAERNSSINLPLRAYKGSVYEGGIRVPFLMCWPGVLPAGRPCAEMVSSLDVLPTSAAAAGAMLPDDRVIDGVDLLPFLTRQTRELPRGDLFWRLRNRKACRRGNWKLVISGDQPPELYNLASDLSEQKDLASERADILEDVLAAYRDWEAEMLPPPPPGIRTLKEL